MISFDKVTWQVGSYPAQCGKIYQLHLAVFSLLLSLSLLWEGLPPTTALRGSDYPPLGEAELITRS